MYYGKVAGAWLIGTMAMAVPTQSRFERFESDINFTVTLDHYAIVQRFRYAWMM